MLAYRTMVAQSTDPVYHCLIDTGALVMGFTNEEVAKLLLKMLPEATFAAPNERFTYEKTAIYIYNGKIYMVYIYTLHNYNKYIYMHMC